MSQVMAFDYGTRWIGVAVGQTIGCTGQALKVLAAKHGTPPWEQIGTLIACWQPSQLIVGLPLNMDGSESEMSQQARKFARRLSGRTGLPAMMVDERLSTAEARSLGVVGRGDNRAGAVDADAALVILLTWLADRSIAKPPDRVSLD